MDARQEIVDAIKARDETRACALLAMHPNAAHSLTPDKTMPLLQMALYSRMPRLVDALLAAGAPVSIHEAAILGDAQRVHALVTADPTLLAAPAADGGMPLHYAAHFGKLDVLALLVELGANVNLQCRAPLANMPLHAACAGAQDAAVDALLHAGAEPNAVDANGYTPLMIAAANGRIDAVRALLAKGADAARPGASGRTALDHARTRSRDDVAALLTQASASAPASPDRPT